MVMITGGAYQGKTAYAMDYLGVLCDDIADGRNCDTESVKKARCISNYHELVRRLGDDSISFTKELCSCNPDAVIIIDEIGCGIIPMEKADRVWRENVGRCGCIIAANSQKVIRMICGIPTLLKGENE
ncbi:MAG: adenosylcobinamide kinase [Ruminococcus sp.]|nr:adenosylcobinamide kinase [Ruminococcus sp.]